MVQQGIQSLMTGGQQAPMPGQAPQMPMQGMMPKPSAATPPAQIKLLETKPSRELRAMYDQQPTLALLTAYTRALKREQLDESMRGQQAMQQAATTRGTVADEIMSQPVMAASGGIMQGYAGGGAVAFGGGGALKFQTAGAVPPGLLNPDFDEEGLPRSKDERASIIDYNERLKAAYQKQAQAQATQAQAAAATAPRPTYPEEAKQRLEQFYKFGPRGSGGVSTDTSPAPTAAPMRMQDTRGGTPEMAALAQMLGTGSASAPAPAGPQRQPGAAPAAPANMGLPADTPIDTAAYRQRLENLASGIRTGSQPSEAVLSGRQGLAALAAQNIAEQRKEAKDAETAAKEALERKLQFTRSNPFTDAQSLFRIASAIDPRRGMALKSLSGGIAGEMEKRTAAEEAARKEFSTTQEAARQRNALIRQAQFLEATRAHAEAVGDDATEKQARQELARLYVDLEKFDIDVQQKAKDQALARYNAQSQRMGAEASRAQAAKPTGTVALLRELGLAPTLENLGKVVEAQQGPKSSAAIRKELVEQWSKNLMLQQKFPNFEDFVAATVPEASAAAAGAGEFKVLSSRPK